MKWFRAKWDSRLFYSGLTLFIAFWGNALFLAAQLWFSEEAMRLEAFGRYVNSSSGIIAMLIAIVFAVIFSIQRRPLLTTVFVVLAVFSFGVRILLFSVLQGLQGVAG